MGWMKGSELRAVWTLPGAAELTCFTEALFSRKVVHRVQTPTDPTLPAPPPLPLAALQSLYVGLLGQVGGESPPHCPQKTLVPPVGPGGCVAVGRVEQEEEEAMPSRGGREKEIKALEHFHTHTHPSQHHQHHHLDINQPCAPVNVFPLQFDAQ